MDWVEPAQSRMIECFNIDIVKRLILESHLSGVVMSGFAHSSIRRRLEVRYGHEEFRRRDSRDFSSPGLPGEEPSEISARSEDRLRRSKTRA